MHRVIEIRSTGIAELNYSLKTTPRQQHLLIPGFQAVSLAGRWGEMLFQHFKRPGYWLWYSHYDMFESRAFEARINQQVLEFTFQFFNGSEYFTYPFKHKTVKQTEFNLMYLPYVESQVNFAKGQQCTTFDIHCDYHFFTSIGSYFADLMDPFIDLMVNKKAVQLYEQPMYATAFMVDLVQLVLREINSGRANELILELHVKSLICYAIVCKYELNIKKRKVTLEEISRVHQLTSKILQDLSQIPGVADMARMSNMNETTFRQLFKKVHQASPKEFFSKKRMLLALEKITMTNRSITDIALEIGFANVHTFSKAFRKQFINSPTAYRR